MNNFAEDSRPVCILGLGLIGGSLMRDLRSAGHTAFGWNRGEATVTAAAADGFDVSGDLESTLRRAEAEDALVVLGVPMPALDPLLRALKQHAPSVGFTDVTSVKVEVHELVEQHGLSNRFVGSHPMAGTAHSGWDATLDGLFQEAVWVVTYDNAVELRSADDSATTNSIKKRWLDTWVRVVRMAQAVGADVVPTVARRHDRAVARISHLPHVLAEALAVAGDAGGPLALTLAAGSFRDGTRVAGTAPELVRAMCENNRTALVTALDETLELLAEARAQLADGSRDLADLTQDGYAARERFEARAGRKAHRPIIRVRPGAKGWVEQLESAESIGAQISIF